MKKGIPSNFCFLGVIGGLVAGSIQIAASAPEVLRADLDGDGKEERISWVKFAETVNEGDFYQVRVTDGNGGLLWEGPKVADTENPLVFGDWHFGFSLPELVADIDGDGAVEMVTPAPQSDVSPTFFRVVRWQGGRFVLARSGILLESPKGTGKFPWSEANEWQGTWISSFLGRNEDGTLAVELFEYRGEVDVRIGKAAIAPVAGGYEVRKWTEAMRPPSDEPVSEPIMTPSSGGITYRARLSAADHFNSAGERLEKVGDILRQDRANFHRSKGDAEDSTDSLFGTREARDKMETMRPVTTDAGAIISGTPLVEVEVSGNDLKVRIISP